MDTQITNTKINPSASLFSTIYTKQDLLLFYKEVDQIMTNMFTEPENFEETASGILAPEKKTAVFNFLKQENVKMNNPVDIKVGLSKIKKIGDNLPIVSLRLAYEPTEAVIKTISSWFIKKLGQKVVIDFSLERSIIGGVYISYNGLYKDYTLKTKVEKYFEKSVAAA